MADGSICKTLTAYPLSLLTVYRSFAFLLLLGVDFILFALTHCILDFDFFFLSDNFFMIKVTYGFLTYLSLKCFAKISIAFSISIISLCKRKREVLALSFQEKRAQNIFNRLAFHADVLRDSSRVTFAPLTSAETKRDFLFLAVCYCLKKPVSIE